jgi:hypothetical protein
MAVRPTTFMGRLPKILGAETCERLQQEATDGSINRLRETAIYVSCSADGTISTPAMGLDRNRAREIVLLGSKVQMIFWLARRTSRINWDNR